MAWTVTEQSARALSRGDKDDLIKFDDKFPRFGVRVRKLASGKEARSYIFQFKLGGKSHRMHCGNVGVVTAQAARKIAEGHEVTLRSSGNPAADRRAQRTRSAHTLGETIEAYFAAMAAKLRANTLRNARSSLLRHWAKFHKHALGEITRRDVAEHLETLGEKSPSAANAARSNLSAVYEWAWKKQLCEDNPVTKTEKQAANGPRERVLTDAEIAQLWQATENGDRDYIQIVRLLLLTGCRVREIAELQWSEVSLPERSLTVGKERSKNGNAHLVPLAPRSLAILQSRPRYAANVFGRGQRGFSAFSGCKRLFDRKLKFETEWTLHDLRRTMATGLQRLGVRLEVSEAVLNHTGAARSGVAGVYHLHDYAAEKRAALEAWESYILTCVARANGANVTQLRTA